MTAEKLLAEAAAVVRDRRHTYGQPMELFEHVAKRWSLVLGVEVTAAQAILCLIDLKVARLTHDPRSAPRAQGARGAGWHLERGGLMCMARRGPAAERPRVGDPARMGRPAGAPGAGTGNPDRRAGDAGEALRHLA